MGAAFRAAIVVYMAFVVCSCHLPWGEAQSDCSALLTTLQGCLPYLTSPTTKPDNKSCCAPLETVLSKPSSVQCLCAAQASNSQSQDLKNALLLPQSCNLPITISEANCTTPSAKTPPTSTTPASPGTSSAQGSRSPSAGMMSASPLSPLLALAFIWSIVSFLA